MMPHPSRDIGEGLSAAAARCRGSFLLPMWAALVSGTAAFDDFLAAVRVRRRLTYLTIDTTGACDLRCAGMCYYHPKIALSKPLVDGSLVLESIRRAANELSLRVLTFAGKEPFLNAVRLFSLVRQAGSLPARDFLTGIVTNGRHVMRNAESLHQAVEEGALDYIDVSIDSANAADHDLFRGARGTHSMAIEAVNWLNSQVPTLRTTVVSVLRWENPKGILDLIRDLAPRNAFYQIQPIQPPPYSSIPPLTADHVVRFMSRVVDSLCGPLRGAKVSVSIELLGIYLLEAVQAGLFRWDDIREDENGTLYVEQQIGENRLIVTCEVFPLQAWRLARITYSGAYLAHMHFLQSPDPDRFATGHLATETIASLFDRAMNPESFFGQIVRSRSAHECLGRPCWPNCFGGWNGAENAFLENGRKLWEQPRLCTKGSEELARIGGTVSI
jgi:pyruvate-formate lyase-activating enzyme